MEVDRELFTQGSCHLKIKIINKLHKIRIKTMEQLTKRKVTVIYYSDSSLELLHEVHDFEENMDGRVVIPEIFKVNKSIIAVCDGEIEILNKVGDRIMRVDYVA